MYDDGGSSNYEPDGRISNVEFRYNENGIETISTPPKILIKHGEPIGRPINPKKPPRDREKGEILEPRLYKVVANILQVPKATGIGVYPSPYEIPYFGSGRSTAPHIPISDNNVYGIKVAAYPHDFVIGVGTQPDTMTEIVRYGLYQIPIKRTGEGWLVGYVETLNQGQKEERVIFRPKGYTHDGRVWYASK